MKYEASFAQVLRLLSSSGLEEPVEVSRAKLVHVEAIAMRCMKATIVLGRIDYISFVDAVRAVPEDRPHVYANKHGEY